MSRLRKQYPNRTKRGGISPNATDTQQKAGRSRKDYHRQEVAFHGSEMAYSKWSDGGKKGYNRSE